MRQSRVATVPDPMCLERNLAALATHQPRLVERLRPAPFAVTTTASTGEPTTTLEVPPERRLHSAYAPGLEARAQLDTLDPTQPAWLVGLGLGYLADALLERDVPGLLVTEPNLSLIKTALALFDFEAPLAAGRMRLCQDEREDHGVLTPLPPQRFIHPAMADVYEDRARRARFEARREGARGTVLMMHGKLFVADLSQLLEAEGWAVRIAKPAGLDVARFDALLDETKPRFLFTVNFSPELAFLATRRGLTYLSWTIDPLPPSRLQLLPGTDPKRCVAFAHRHAIVEALKAAGLPRCAFMPLAASPSRRPAEQGLDPYRCAVSFVGSSLVVEERSLMKRIEALEAPPTLWPRLKTWLDELFEARGRDLSFEGIGPDDLPPFLRSALPEADAVELADRANGALSHRLRMRRVELLEDLKIDVYGDDGWEPLGGRYRGRAHHGEELTTIYTASGTNLDVPRIYQRDIVTMRVFDVMRCRGVVLAEESPALKALFDDAHLLTYRDDASLRAQVLRLRDDPTLGATIGEAARRHVEANHTMRHRLATLLKAVDEDA